MRYEALTFYTDLAILVLLIGWMVMDWLQLYWRDSSDRLWRSDCDED